MFRLAILGSCAHRFIVIVTRHIGISLIPLSLRVLASAVILITGIIILTACIGAVFIPAVSAFAAALIAGILPSRSPFSVGRSPRLRIRLCRCILPCISSARLHVHFRSLCRFRRSGGCSLTEAWGVSSFCPPSAGFSSSHSLSMISAFFRVLIPFNPCAFATFPKLHQRECL